MYRWQFWQHHPVSETKFVCEDNSKLTFKTIGCLLCGFKSYLCFLYQLCKCWPFDLMSGVITFDFCNREREKTSVRSEKT